MSGSVANRSRRSSGPQPVDRVLWTVRPGSDVVTRAVVRVLPHGRQLRLLVNGSTLWARVFPLSDHDALFEETDAAHEWWREWGWNRASQ